MGIEAWRIHLRQGSLFLVVGLAQLAIDTSVFIAVTAIGTPVVAGNVLGRLSGACLGFWLNGRFTFADSGEARLSPRHQVRFAIAWLSLTAISTLALHVAAAHHSLQGVWLIKPMVEAVLAAINFMLSRHWIYR